MANYYISQTGAGSGDGTSVANAFNGNVGLQAFLRARVAGDVIYIESGTYDQSCVFNTYNGSLFNYIKFIGVRTLAGLESANGDDRPHFNLSNNRVFRTGSYWLFENLRFTQNTCTSGYTFSLNRYSIANNIKVKNINVLYAFAYETVESFFINCEAEANNGIGFRLTSSMNLLNCYAHDCVTGIECLGNYNIFDNCIVSNCNKGINISNNIHTIKNSVFYNCNDGIYINASRGYSNIYNSIFSSCVNGVNSVDVSVGNILKNNCFYNNTNNVVNINIGENNILENPKFVDAVGGDFSLEIDSPCKFSGIKTLVGIG